MDALVLCEGSTESEIVKIIIEKLKPAAEKNNRSCRLRGNRFSNSISSVMILLTRLFKRVKAIGVILDSENFTVEKRIMSFVDSLNAKGLKVRNFEQICHQTFILHLENQNLKIYVSVSGVHEFSNFKRHSIEDHRVLLLLRRNPNIEGRIRSVESAQEIISKDILLHLVKGASTEELYKTCTHIFCLLKNL